MIEQELVDFGRMIESDFFLIVKSITESRLVEFITSAKLM